MKRRLLACLALLATVAIAFGLLARPRDRITQANAARIRAGMTQAEVEDILGGPAGNYSRPPRRYGFFGPECPQCVCWLAEDLPPGQCREKTWWGDSCRVAVIFDKDQGTVARVQCLTFDGGPTAGEAAANLFEDVRRRLGF